MARTMTYTGELTIETCWCGIVHAVPSDLVRQARSDGKSVYCPLGHAWVFAESDAAKQRKRAEKAERAAASAIARADQARAEAEHQAAVARGYKGAMVQAKTRAAKGVCPVPGCRRHFVDVERHVASKHPDYAAGEVA